MMEINGPSRIDGAESIRGPQNVRAIEPQSSTDSLQAMDQVDISASVFD